MSIMIHVSSTPRELGAQAANAIASLLNDAVSLQGYARLVLSTGASQFDTLDALIGLDVPWNKIEMFHLDEYVALPESHPASFRKYLKDRFVSRVPLKAAYFVDGEGDVAGNIAALSRELTKQPVDVGVIGIGENGHIAFNDPPADFNTQESYKIVDLDERCKKQQVGEGWFADVDSVPKQAITMCVQQIMSCRHIISAVPHTVKADAILRTVTEPVNPNVPATILKTHPDWKLFLDTQSAANLLSL